MVCVLVAVVLGERGWAGVMSVLVAGPGICILCYADSCASYVHPVSSMHIQYLLPNLYLSVADSANPSRHHLHQ